MGESKIGIYHRIMERENFEVAAKDIFMLIQNAQKNMPNKPRALYVDIDGHRNKAGGFDQDMFELQKEFGMTVLLPFVQEMHFPLFSIEIQMNKIIIFQKNYKYFIRSLRKMMVWRNCILKTIQIQNL